ncbi:hypothetical protein [Alicyclobacillus dauci]|uniref:Uncharacterized protein n=1 Tax=Alicyclobacillus dauci TaxID=1475485 RepID=A0ABY6Z1X7_9BACL|nr:hypothetical protein [Alicyclobacillus dauci]WAH36897.1 hypothetical protein NZD86_22490 [Alicyclobacillus dauci]
MSEEDKQIRIMMERMREEMAREWSESGGSGTGSTTRLGDWSSRACGQFGAVLYARARALIRGGGSPVKDTAPRNRGEDEFRRSPPRKKTASSRRRARGPSTTPTPPSSKRRAQLGERSQGL